MQKQKKRIAIIGGGISGMSAAYLLSSDFNVTLYESENRLGGHARTIMAGRNGDQPVDTGFIVFNYVNYPHLTQLFMELEVPVERSRMSFGVSLNDGRIEFGLENFASTFGQKSNLFSLPFYGMLRDILKFNKYAEASLGPDVKTVGDLLDRLKLGERFKRHYLLPICGAIWSSPTKDIRQFPAWTLIHFFRNHALLSHTGQHQWWTVKGGSIEYVKRLSKSLKEKGCSIKLGDPVLSVERNADDCSVHTENGSTETFDEVVFACHSDQALSLIDQPSQQETEVLTDLKYQKNKMVLHCDLKQMPKNRKCWSSWIYKGELQDERSSIAVTYWMNNLQNIPEEDPLFVTLNPSTEIEDKFIYDQTDFSHPVYDLESEAARTKLAKMQGQNRSWFVGAYLRYGFHEDGFASSVRIARQLKAANG